MAGSAEGQLDGLTGQIAVLKAQRNDQILIIDALTEHGWDTAAEVLALQQIEKQLAALQDRIATFEGDPRHV